MIFVPNEHFMNLPVTINVQRTKRVNRENVFHTYLDDSIKIIFGHVIVKLQITVYKIIG